MNAIVTVNIGEEKPEVFNYTHPVFEKICDRYGWDLVEITDIKIKPDLRRRPNRERILFQKFQIGNLLDKYDRILHLDGDILLSPDFPDIFELVPEDTVAAVREDLGSRERHRIREIRNTAKAKNINWKEIYLNTGVYVVSQMHQDIFLGASEDYYEGYWVEQTTWNYRIRKFGFKVKTLPYQFNHMSMFSEDWNGSPDRLDSYTIHYASGGFPGDTVLNQVKHDFGEWYANSIE